MISSRFSHGICFINEFIYVTGGIESESKVSDKCERYNIINDTWVEIPSLENERYGMTIIPMG